MQRARLILASASPRRHELLKRAGLDFEVEPADADESLPHPDQPELSACELARRKARLVAAKYAGRMLWVIGADTLVALGHGHETRILGKPEDAGQARDMLSSLSGQRHRVITGVAVVACRDAACHSGFERTWVSMRLLEGAEVAAYVSSGEWRDKAGGYAIQETADAFVTRLEEGGFDNVVGLPVDLCQRLLSAAGWPPTA